MNRGARFLMLFLLSTQSAAAADCPTNTMYAMGHAQVSSSYADSYSQSFTCTADGHPVFASGTASYNLVTGRFAAVAQGGSGCGASSGLSTHDVFTLTGPPSGSLSFRAQLDVEYHGGNFPSSASIQGGNTTASTGPTPGPFTSIWITIVRSPGASFDLYIGAVTGGTGFGTLTAALSFPDLPQGYMVQSCQGFVAGTPVPTRGTQWGRLKALYR
jgi:hypothetical protein